MLGISIVLFNTPVSDVFKCIHSIKKFNINHEITIIDNSLNSSEDFNKFLNLNYIHNPTNPGFGSAHNLALLKSIENNYDYHLVLNADVYFEEDVLNYLVEFLSNNPNIGIAMPKVLYPSGRIQYLCKLVPTPFDLFGRRFLPKFLRERLNNNFEMRGTGYKRVMFVPYLSGCFMFIRISMLKQVGLFDERYFMYPEDIDLTRRMAISFDTIFCPHVHIYHGFGGASKKSLKMFYIHSINIIRYFNKWGWFFDREREALNKKALFLLNRESYHE